MGYQKQIKYEFLFEDLPYRMNIVNAQVHTKRIKFNRDSCSSVQFQHLCNIQYSTKFSLRVHL